MNKIHWNMSELGQVVFEKYNFNISAVADFVLWKVKYLTINFREAAWQDDQTTGAVCNRILIKAKLKTGKQRSKNRAGF